jgi:CDP-glucose 4,6-dehydratase
LDTVPDQVHEAHYLKLDCSKAHMLLGWKPIWNLEHALDRIIDWHRAALQGHDLYAKTVEHLREYQQTLELRASDFQEKT